MPWAPPPPGARLWVSIHPRRPPLAALLLQKQPLLTGKVSLSAAKASSVQVSSLLTAQDHFVLLFTHLLNCKCRFLILFPKTS